MPLELVQRHAACHVPDYDLLVLTRRGQSAPVEIEGHPMDPPSMPLERAQLLVAGRVPDLNRLVPARRGQSAAVGAEDHAVYIAGMAFESAQLQLAQAILVIPFPAARVALARRRP